MIPALPASAQTDIASNYGIGVFRLQLNATSGATMSLVAAQSDGANDTMVFLIADHTLYASTWTGNFTIGYGNLATPQFSIAVTPGMYTIVERGPTGTEDMALLAVRFPLAAVNYFGGAPAVTSIPPLSVATAPTPGGGGYTVQWVGYGLTPDDASYGTQHTFLGQVIAIDPGLMETQNSHTYTQTETDNHFTCGIDQSYGYSGESGSPTLFPVSPSFPLDTASGSIIGLYAEAHAPAGNPVCPGVIFDYYGLAFGTAEVNWIRSTTAKLITGLAPSTTDGPIPLWAYGALGAGLIGIASRRLRKRP